MRILLDISRLISGTRRRLPTGIDRVEYAYARHCLGRDDRTVSFVVRGPFGPTVAVPHKLVADLLPLLGKQWEAGDLSPDLMKAALRLARQARRRQWLGLGRDELEKGLNGPGSPIYLLVSHRLAHWPRPIVALKKRGARFVALVHDLIPTNYPEYAPTNGTLDHVARVNTFATLADGIIVNSAATAAELAPHLQNGIINIPLLAASLGIDAPRTDTNFPRPAGPYFVCLGTIEPRKNHLLLLHIWRDLAQRMGMETPKLLIIGRRGWKNENIIDMLERCPALAGVVREYADLPDDAVAGLLQGARALLFPSFAEGYGLPLAEALALGVPAICSDLPALREVGGDAPDYLSPLDGLGWRHFILGFAEEDSRLREKQLQRLAQWSRPSWTQHFALVDPWLRQFASLPDPVAARQNAALSHDVANPVLAAMVPSEARSF